MTEREKGNETVFGIVSLVLGIVSLMLFCACVNWLTGTLAIVFGVIQLVKNRERGLAIGGIVTAGLSLVLSLVLYLSIAAGMGDTGVSYDELYREYFGDGAAPGLYDSDGDYRNDNYDDYYNDYYDDYYDYFDDYYDYYDYGEGGQEFL